MARRPMLRETVRIERRAAVDDGYGNVISGGWSSTASPIYAEIKPMRGREEVLAGKLSGTMPFEITLRWRSDLAEGVDRLTTADRVVNVRTGETYNIRSIENPDMRNRWLLLTCEAGVAD